MKQAQPDPLVLLLAELKSVRWLAHAGEPFPGGILVPDVATAFDDWSKSTFTTWSCRTHALERRARKQLGEPAIDHVFRRISIALDKPLRAALKKYFDRRPNGLNANTECNADLGLWPELLETMKRDIAWAAVERLLGTPDFFSALLAFYRAGRWPCSWRGKYPKGKVAVL